MSTLGRLEKVDLREIWRTEDQDFTPWLAREDNLAVLSETLGMELELEAEEKRVGPFRADILCRSSDDGSWVLIENQLERTDHSHLGQLLTYASGLQAVTIVWIAARFSEEHRAALDWLNEITDDHFSFFGLEVELWRIGDSPAAPKFNIISRPNDWSRSVSDAARRIKSDALTETKAAQLQFWTDFAVYLQEHGSSLRSQKAYPQHWTNFSIGRSGFLLGALHNTADSLIAAELYMNDDFAKAYFAELLQHRDEIEAELGFQLDWRELPDRKACRLIIEKRVDDPLDTDFWPQYYAWLKDKLDAMHRVFRPRVRQLTVS
ncbi:DUF4268 domain-containing protein [Henriciella sp. AS95]|uniref:DUF4268 domain-containing protein n=1 Tax=Henriciella sp. AS95 TaxID=3135782 RepID=UPI00318216AD